MYTRSGGPTRVERLVLWNLRGFEDLDLAFPPGPVTLFVGRNGSGKSTLVHALAWALGAHDGPSASDLRHGASRLSIEATVEGQPLTVGWEPRKGTTRRGGARPPGFVRVLRTDRATSVDALRSAEEETGRNWDAPTQDPWDPEFWSTSAGKQTFGFVLPWFRREENLENEVRLRRDPAFRSVRLESVRQTLRRALTGLGWTEVGTPRISRVGPGGKPRSPGTDGEFVLDKGGEEYTLAELSDGERLVVLLVLDLAIRVAERDHDAALAPGILVLDEVEQHLHPGWQARLLPALHEALPAAQIIATTHSPLVVASAPPGSVRVLDQFRVYESPPSSGRDANSLLSVVFGVPPRPAEPAARIAEIERLIDADELVEARSRLDRLSGDLTAEDPDLVRLRTVLEFLGR
jgi:energy-coupling factor transporter ATP-binding protein EcfA2